MAEDPGFLLVQAGLVRDDQLLDAREAQAQGGGTLGEHLVLAGSVDDDDLTAFYASKLVIPRVAAEDLARIPASVLDRVPADMAVELRVVPVALDGERNVTLVMSDPTDQHVVEEVGFFTGCYVVRAVATQLQIAWCLAHYYGVMTPLARARLVDAGDGSHDDDDDVSDEASSVVQGTPSELEEEEETGPALMPFQRRQPVRRRTSELAPRSGTVDVPEPPAEPERLPAVVVDDEELDRAAVRSGQILVLDRTVRHPTSQSSPMDPMAGHRGAVDSRGQASHDTEVAHGSPWVGNEGENVTVRRQSKADRRGRRRSRGDIRTDPLEVTTDPMHSIPPTQAEKPDTPAIPETKDEGRSMAQSNSKSGALPGAMNDEEGAVEATTDPDTTDRMRLGGNDSGSSARSDWNVDEGWDVDDGWDGPRAAPVHAASVTADPVAALAADAAVVAAASAAAVAALAALPTPAAEAGSAAAQASAAGTPQADVDPAELAAELERSSVRLLETLRALERAPGRDEVVDVLLDHLGASLRRRAFFAVKSGGVLFAFRQYGAARPGVGTAELSLDQPSTFAQVATNRLPYRGTLSPAAIEFVERALGSSGKGEAVVVPVVVRGRAVGLLYGDGLTARLFDEHQMVLVRAAGQAFERILTTRAVKA